MAHEFRVRVLSSHEDIYYITANTPEEAEGEAEGLFEDSIEGDQHITHIEYSEAMPIERNADGSTVVVDINTEDYGY